MTGFEPSMSADATLAGMPLSVPWSVQYSFLRRHSGIEIIVTFMFTVKAGLHFVAFYISLNTT